MASGEKNAEKVGICAEAEKVDDGYARSCSNSATEEIDTETDTDGIDSDESYEMSDESSSSSGIESSDKESRSSSDLSSGIQPPIKVRPLNDPKFNPETRAVLWFDSTRHRSAIDFFQPPMECSLCGLKFKTIGELNVHTDDKYHQLLLKIAAVGLCSREDRSTDHNHGEKMPRIHVKANYEPANDGIEARVNIMAANPSLDTSMQLEHLYWIDKNNNDRLMVFNELITFPREIAADSSRKFCVPFAKFSSTKKYELILYFQFRGEQYVSKCYFHITNKPILTMRMAKLGHYFPSASVRSLQKTKFELPTGKVLSEEEKLLHEKVVEFKTADQKSRLTSDNYHAMMKLMLQMEDETESTKCLAYDQTDQAITHVRSNVYSLKIKSKSLEEAAAEYTRLWITPMSMRKEALTRNDAIRKILEKDPKANVEPWRTQRIYGTIAGVKNGAVHIDLDRGLNTFTAKTKVAPNDEVYFVRFMSNRTTIALEHRALDLLDQHKISKFFFPHRDNLLANSLNSDVDNAAPIKWISDVNEEQRSAVENILKSTAYPFPYILFGPPGTGKTKTLVEAIAQVVKRNNAAEHILVCAASNSACDEVADRLLKLIQNDQVFRMFSISQTDKMGIIPRDVLAASNLCKAEHYYPTLVKLYQYKVVICTLTTAGRLSQANINPRHFTHIFIDESGSATESQLLIAIAGISTSKDKIHANITFAGDPKQLGPIIKSHAVKLGYGVSMLERLMNTDMYDRDITTKLFNAKYVTQLVRNYRSHETLLHVSNELFYDNALRVHATKSNTDWFLNSSLLQASQFPFIFHSVQGRTVKKHKETSPYNTTEVNLVITYLEKLFSGDIIKRKINQSDVGIISPYRKQCEKLTEKCHQLKWTDIQIGSVETFQGQERPIIIVSTVRSRMQNIGFLDNTKRLNVLLTRAKCLMIIIGDAKTLAIDKNWAHVIKYCENNGSLIK